jgi:hypothetical protein
MPSYVQTILSHAFLAPGLTRESRNGVPILRLAAAVRVV